MALVVGHSQTKYLCDYLCDWKYSVFSYPGARTADFLTKESIREVAPFFSVSLYIV